MSKEISVGIVFNDGDRSGVSSWTPAIRINGHQFNGRDYRRKEAALTVAESVARILDIKTIEETQPIW